MSYRYGVLCFLIVLLLLACKEEKVPKRFYPRSDHEAYWYSLKQANLLGTALGKEWEAAAERPFENQIEIDLPYQEAFQIMEKEPDAMGYRFDVRRGQKVLVDIDLISKDSAVVFIDLFRVENDSLRKYRHVASADSSFQLGFEPRRNASYILRLQPELLRGGNYTIKIQKVPSLDFPVAGKDQSAIHSFFGDPRDGGRRDHHGVDIFAPRHTPVIAPARAYVRFVGERGLGGNVIWLYDSQRSQNLYFAHLQDQLVEKYTYVNKGDTIGTVGNSGNARTTPTHLHFGIYSNGPVDPYFFIVEEAAEIPNIELDTSLLGKTLHVAKNTVLQSGMNTKSQLLDTLEVNEKIDVLAVNDKYVRVKAKNGNQGFLNRRVVVSPGIR